MGTVTDVKQDAICAVLFMGPDWLTLAIEECASALPYPEHLR